MNEMRRLERLKAIADVMVKSSAPSAIKGNHTYIGVPIPDEDFEIIKDLAKTNVFCLAMRVCLIIEKYGIKGRDKIRLFKMSIPFM